MQTVRKLAEDIVGREGGFVDDPDDPGGATKYGVTIGTLKRLNFDVDGDGSVGKSDVRSLSKDQAVEIFLKHYFEAPRIGILPERLHASVFDMYVNSGAQAIRILQKLLRKMGYTIHIDGKIGPQTARVSHAALNDAPDHLVDAYGIERRSYYYRLADHRPASRKYARRRDGGKGGWIRRAEEFISAKYHLSDSQHRERTRSWA